MLKWLVRKRLENYNDKRVDILATTLEFDDGEQLHKILQSPRHAFVCSRCLALLLCPVANANMVDAPCRRFWRISNVLAQHSVLPPTSWALGTATHRI